MSGDAVVRRGLRGRSAGWILLGCVVLAGYGLVVNSVKWDFSKLLGVYVGFFALVSILLSKFILRETIPPSTWLGLALIILGGMVIQFGQRVEDYRAQDGALGRVQEHDVELVDGAVAAGVEGVEHPKHRRDDREILRDMIGDAGGRQVLLSGRNCGMAFAQAGLSAEGAAGARRWAPGVFQGTIRTVA